MRYAAGVEYCGTAYSGWQRQHHARTVQGELEQALSTIADHPVKTTCAGRTDAGVHAMGQVVHFDSPQDRTPRSWCLGSNTHLPPDISLSWVRPVVDDFSARYSALSRSYRYLILDNPNRSALFNNRVTWSRYSLDHEAMHVAAQALTGEHDFSSFRASECQSNSPVREVFSISVRRQQQLIALDIKANAFVHHMVRNIAGVLMAIGNGRRPIDWTQEVLALRNRSLGGVTAPPDGLYLRSVCYPEEFAIPVSGEINVFCQQAYID